MNGSARALLASLLVLLALAGCAPAAQTPPAADDGIVSDAEPVAEDGSWQEGSLPIRADEEVMASMSCEEFDEAGLERLSRLGLFGRAVSVEACEKDGSTWWVVVADSAEGDGAKWTRAAYLTDALVQSDYSGGTWIKLSDEDPWQNVSWDDDLLVRGQSALNLAKDTLTGLDWVR